MEVEAPSPKVNGYHTPPPASDASLDPSQVLDYLESLLSLTLGASKDELEGDRNPLSDGQRQRTVEVGLGFLTGQRVALYASKREEQASQINGDTEDLGK